MQPVTRPAVQSITPSNINRPLASQMPANSTSTNSVDSSASTTPSAVEVEPTQDDNNTAAVSFTVIVLALISLAAFGMVVLLMRLKRSDKWCSARRASSSSQGSAVKDAHQDAIKTISAASSTFTSSTLSDDGQGISLQHWSTRKAVSNRYESYCIGETPYGSEPSSPAPWVSKNHLKR